MSTRLVAKNRMDAGFFLEGVDRLTRGVGRQRESQVGSINHLLDGTEMRTREAEGKAGEVGGRQEFCSNHITCEMSAGCPSGDRCQVYTGCRNSGEV